jgi:hypothetical protein
VAINHSKVTSILFILVVSVVFIGSAYAGTIFVDIGGSDSSGTGISSKPLRTVKEALNRAEFGDKISINNGTYSEGQLIVPEGVSITSTSESSSKVKLQPNVGLDKGVPFLLLSSSTPGSTGNQSISHIEFNGTNESNSASFAIEIVNRDNIRIHHCSFHDFKLPYTHEADYPKSLGVIEVKSTQIGRTNGTNRLWSNYWPADSGPVGDDSTIDALWPANPVKNFELDNNTITNCYAVRPYNIKDSSIHHNTIDNRNSYLWCLQGTAAFLDNVDIHDNKLLARRSDFPKHSFHVELWVHRGGCQYYNNESNAFYSITVGKGTKVYNNIIDFSPASVEQGQCGYAIEFNLQSHSYVYNNTIKGALVGIVLGIGNNTANAKDYVLENQNVYNNRIYNSARSGIYLKSLGAYLNSGKTITSDINIYGNYIDGKSSSSQNGIYICQKNDVGDAEMSNVNITENIIVNHNGYAGTTFGVISNLIIDSNNFYGNTYNYWKGSDATNTDFSEISEPPPLIPPDQDLVPPTFSIIVAESS